MSGNNSRKHKRYMLMLQRTREYGSIEKTNTHGFSDLVAYSAAIGEIVTATPGNGYPYKRNSSSKSK